MTPGERQRHEPAHLCFYRKLEARCRRVRSIWRQMAGWDVAMASRAGRTKRPNGVGRSARKATVRLAPPSWDVAERAAAALGVSRDAYLDQVLAREAAQLDEHDRPVWWTDPVPGDQIELSLPEEAPLKSA